MYDFKIRIVLLAILSRGDTWALGNKKNYKKAEVKEVLIYPLSAINL